MLNTAKRRAISDRLRQEAKELQDAAHMVKTKQPLTSFDLVISIVPVGRELMVILEDGIKGMEN